jgi:glycolate oxidase FAD binding subunit
MTAVAAAPVPSGLAEAMRAAAERGARVMPRGSGQWWPGTLDGAQALGGADTGIVRVDAADHVATVGAGCTLADLDAALAAHGAFVALDPPGPASRTIGGALAAGGAGPLGALYGPPRDQILGMTFLAGNATAVRTGGRVVKNVAGFDLAKAVIGSHGAFGYITETHLRLRARPAADRTRAFAGGAEAVVVAGRSAMAGGVAPAAFEILSPALAEALGGPPEWVLAARALGTSAGVDEELDAVAAAVHAAACADTTMPADLWSRWRDAVGGWPVILRVGADPATWPQALALARRHGAGLLGASITVPRGTVRLGLARLTAVTARALRADAAQAGWPVTLERADPATREAVGVWGALPPGVERLVRDLHATFDPLHLFAVPLLAAT